MLKYTNIELDFMEPGCFDHTPIVVDTKTTYDHSRRPFKLLNVVMQQKNFQDSVYDIWLVSIIGVPMFRIWTNCKN